MNQVTNLSFHEPSHDPLVSWTESQPSRFTNRVTTLSFHELSHDPLVSWTESRPSCFMNQVTTVLDSGIESWPSRFMNRVTTLSFHEPSHDPLVSWTKWQLSVTTLLFHDHITSCLFCSQWWAICAFLKFPLFIKFTYIVCRPLYPRMWRLS